MNFGYEKHKTCVLCFLFPVHIELNLLVWNFTSKCYLASESKLYLLENSYLDHREAIKRRAGDQIMWTNRKAGLGLLLLIEFHDCLTYVIDWFAARFLQVWKYKESWRIMLT